MNKRILGYLSWQRRRKGIHLKEVLDLLIADCLAEQPDHIAITGDLTNISLPSEFDAVTQWLKQIAEPEKLSVIPGNHDAYINLDPSEGWQKWRAFMTGDAAHGQTLKGGADHGLAFPYLRRRGPLALIGLSSAVATAPGLASGRLGPAQLAKLSDLLDDLARERVIRVLLIHHSPLPGITSTRKELSDAHAFREVLREKGAELILHGHNHRFEQGWLEGASGPVPVVAVPSASALAFKDRPTAHYHLYRFSPSQKGYRMTLERRGYDPVSKQVVSREELDEIQLPGQQ